MMFSFLFVTIQTTKAFNEEVNQFVKPTIEVVFTLDTTGSMSGLIQAAKEKIWAIANTLASATPAPDIKMGLVGYRDRGDEYVTKWTDLTDNLDKVYAELMAFQANGGGDTPESVNEALYTAVIENAWSKDEKTYRVIFLVGDCPPHMDYEDDMKYPDICKKSVERGIIINTIQCGNHMETEPIWSDIAQKGEGRYFRVEQSGGAILASTPFDATLAVLSQELDETRIGFGDATERNEMAERKDVAEKIYHTAPLSAQAQRSYFNVSKSGIKNFAGEKELISAIADGEIKLSEVKKDQLPDNLQSMSVEEREKYVKEMMDKRSHLQESIKKIGAQRQMYIDEQIRKSGLKGKASFDHAIFQCIKEQTIKKGILFSDAQAH